MSDIFENQYEEKEDISKLEDEPSKPKIQIEKFVFIKNLFYARLDYSGEGVYVNSGDFQVKKGDGIVIRTRYGKDLARIMGKIEMPINLKPSEIVKIERIASESDWNRSRELAKNESNAFKVFHEFSSQRGLEMKLISVHFMIDEPKAIFFFSSENRVDFRELVKDLVAYFKLRVELRQIGLRDEARIIGGLGICGRPFCCNSIGLEIPIVSSKMTREQNLSFNMAKLSGPCGKLLCCLSYEYSWYTEARKKLPFEGLHIFYKDTNFKITDVNPLSESVKMIGDDGRLLELPANAFVKENGRWKISPNFKLPD